MTSAVPQAPTSTPGKAGARSAKTQVKPLVERLADVGEEALQRIADLPGGQRVLGAMNDLRSRVDELSKKVRGLDALERRVEVLEKQVSALKSKPPRRSPATRASTRRTTTPPP